MLAIQGDGRTDRPIWLNRRTAHCRSNPRLAQSAHCLLPFALLVSQASSARPIAPLGAAGLRNPFRQPPSPRFLPHLAQSARWFATAPIACFASLLHTAHFRHRRGRRSGATGGALATEPFGRVRRREASSNENIQYMELIRQLPLLMHMFSRGVPIRRVLCYIVAKAMGRRMRKACTD